MSRLVLTLAAAALLVGCSTPANQPPVASSAEIAEPQIVTGSHIPRDEPLVVNGVSTLPSPAEVIDRDRLERSGGSTTADALRRSSSTLIIDGL